ncbi:Ig-like domain-containing protein [Flavonifractor hominis]|uniref:Ig-like domain-containing protein n=1 Tax=Flavonifractor hominis TaxID=3133178 RepID=A0ABV1ER82_9FIRM
MLTVDVTGSRGQSRTVTFAAAPVLVESVGMNKDSLILEEGHTYTLTATVLPEIATNKTVTWSSSDIDVATVD